MHKTLFFVSSMLSKSKLVREIATRYVFSAAKSTVRSLYFSDEVSLYGDAVVRFILSASSIPVVLLIWSVTHSILQCVVWMLIIPVIQEYEEHSNAEGVKIYSFFAVLGHIGFRIAPFITVSACAVSAGNKAMGSFGATLVDGNLSLERKDYPLMRSQLIFMNEKSERFYIWVFVMMFMSAVLLYMIESTITVWLHQQPQIFILAFVAFLSEVVFICVTLWQGMPNALRNQLRLSFSVRRFNKCNVFRVVRNLVTHITDTWWERNFFYMRSIAMCFVALGTLYFCFQNGVVQGVTIGLIILMSFGVPHIFITASLHCASAIIRSYRSFKWLYRHTDALILVFAIACPYQVVMTLAMLYFLHHTPILLLILCNDVLLIAKAIDLVREFDVSEHGSVHWRFKNSGELIRPSIAIVLEDAYEKKQRNSGIVSLDMSFDIGKMQVTMSKTAYKVSRVQVIPFGALRTFRFNLQFYLFTFPRLLSLQHRGDFSGKYFRAIRIMLRVMVVSTFVIILSLVGGIVIQASVPFVRAPAVRAWVSDKAVLAFDHVVLRLFFISAAIEPSVPYSNSSLAKDLSTKWNGIHSSDGEDFYPQLCRREFYGASIFEVAVLAMIPYLFHAADMHKMIDFINFHFGSDWVLRERFGSACQRAANRQPSGWNGYVDLHSVQKNLTVISIRGTDLFSFKDFLIDVSLYFESILYQVAATNVPGAILTPKNLVEDLIRMASIPSEDNNFETWEEISSRKSGATLCHVDNYRRDFFVDVHNHLSYVGSHGLSSNVLLTGHSMGGTLAAIIGSRMHIEALSFSSPGIFLARKKYNLTAHEIHRYVTSVVSSNDVFPSIGEQGGEVHHIVCLARTKETCHAIEFIIGTLWRSCYSIRQRFPLLKDIV